MSCYAAIYNTVALEKQVHNLIEDNEIMKKSGIYYYVLSRKSALSQFPYF